jgi:hypothetical protein
VPNELMDILIKASEQTEYELYNGKAVSKNKSLDLVDSDYVFRNPNKKNINEEYISTQKIQAVVRNFCSNSNYYRFQYTNPTTIYYSGMYWKLRNYLNEHTEVENVDRQFMMKWLKEFYNEDSTFITYHMMDVYELLSEQIED